MFQSSPSTQTLTKDQTFGTPIRTHRDSATSVRSEVSENIMSSPESDHTDSTNNSTAEISFVRRPSDPTPQNIKAYRRELNRQVLTMPTPEPMVKEALEIFDIETGLRALTPDVLSSLEHLFGLEGVEWPSDRIRMYMLGSKVRVSLRRLLQSYGFGSFASYGENHKARLRAMCEPGKTPPPLPDWLQIPYLVPAEGVKLIIIPDGCINPGIQPGHPLHGRAYGSITHNAVAVGTLGTVMVFKDTYVALTAGHIINDFEDVMIVKGLSGEPVLELEVAGTSVRMEGRPKGRAEEAADFRDDCAFLKIKPEDIEHFNHRIPCLNAHYYEFLEASDEFPGDPVGSSRRYSLEDLLLLNDNRVVVFKQGANSDLTMGYFEKILLDAPEGWYVSDEVGKQEVVKDEDEWLGSVRWISEYRPFAGPGDSGSLVFAIENGIKIPLGIHVGSPASMPCCSVFISIETFCYEGCREGWELTFTT